MKLIECYIEAFGKLEGAKYNFSDGLNTVKADNGYGKTTLTVFIKAMLFGLDDTKKAKLEENDRKHYLPWGRTSFGGYLVFESNGKKYRIERTFYPKASEDTFVIYDAKSGKETSDFTENVGEELFGIDVDGFERTVFLSEENISGKNDNKKICAKLSNLACTPGDLSVMGDAIDLLEKKRKIYHKKSGTGEIDSTREKLREVQMQISDLLRVKEKCEEVEEKLIDTRKNLQLTKEKRRTVAKEQERLNERRLKRTYEKQYLEILSEYKLEEERKAVLYSYFENKLPTEKEIDSAERAYKEAARLREVNQKSSIAKEYGELCDFFKSGTSEEEIQHIENLVTEVKIKAGTLSEIPKKQEVYSDVFVSEAPSSEEISSHIEKISDKEEAKGTKKTLVFFFASALLVILGAVFGILIHPALYSLTAFGLVLAVTSVLLLKDKSSTASQRAARAFIASVCKTEFTTEPVHKTLLTMLSESERIERINKENSETEERTAKILSEIEALRKEIDGFIGRFSLPYTNDRVYAISEIRNRFSLYKIISKNEADRIAVLEENEKRASKLYDEAFEFLKNYKTTDKEPFLEIRTRFNEYQAISKSVERMRGMLTAFIKEHGIDPDNINAYEPENEPSLPSIYALDDEISVLENQVAFYENQSNTANAALEKLDELYAEKDILEDKVNEYIGTLDIILKTKKYLEEAKDILTSRYLSKTKGMFDSYVELIAKETGEDFTMDTSFVVKKNDKGALRTVENYSRGTRELYALANRLALIESLYENEKPFLILDDPFAYFDDTRLSTVRELIKKLSAKWQIVYLTCTESRSIK